MGHFIRKRSLFCAPSAPFGSWTKWSCSMNSVCPVSDFKGKLFFLRLLERCFASVDGRPIKSRRTRSWTWYRSLFVFGRWQLSVLQRALSQELKAVSCLALWLWETHITSLGFRFIFYQIKRFQQSSKVSFSSNLLLSEELVGQQWYEGRTPTFKQVSPFSSAVWTSDKTDLCPLVSWSSSDLVSHQTEQKFCWGLDWMSRPLLYKHPPIIMCTRVFCNILKCDKSKSVPRQ